MLSNHREWLRDANCGTPFLFKGQFPAEWMCLVQVEDSYVLSRGVLIWDHLPRRAGIIWFKHCIIPIYHREGLGRYPAGHNLSKEVLTSAAVSLSTAIL